MAGASFPAALRGTDVRVTRSGGCTQVYTEGYTGVYTGVYRGIYDFTPLLLCFTPLLLCFTPVLLLLAPLFNSFTYLFPGPRLYRGQASWLM